MVRFDTFRKPWAGRRSHRSLAGVEKLDRVLVQFQIDPVAVPQDLHCLSVNFAKPIPRGREVFVRHGSRRTPPQFGAKHVDGSRKLFADAHKTERSQVPLSRGQKGGFVGGVRGAVSSDGGKVMRIGILNDCGAVHEVAHEIGKRQLPCLGCYQVMLGCDPPEGMRRKNSPDGIPQQRHTIPAAAESRLSENAEMASDELVMLKSCGRHQMNFGVIQMRADLRGFQILAADRQERGPAGLRDVIEDVVLRKQKRLSLALLTTRRLNEGPKT